MHIYIYINTELLKSCGPLLTSFLQFTISNSISEGERSVWLENWLPVLPAEQPADLLLERTSTVPRHANG